MSSTAPPSYALGELAREAGVPVGTVKYYLREGLLPPGDLRSATRADYGPPHLERLRLLRLLREVGDVPVDRLRDLVGRLEGGARDGSLGLLAAGAAALAGEPPEPGPLADRARVLADELVDAGGWDAVPPAAQEHAALRGVLESVLHWERVGLPVRSADLTTYVEAADLVARHDVASLDDDGDPQAMLTQLVVGQVVYGRLLEVLRRLAEAHHSCLRFGPPTASDDA